MKHEEILFYYIFDNEIGFLGLGGGRLSFIFLVLINNKWFLGLSKVSQILVHNVEIV